MQVYDTLSGAKRELEPLKGNRLNMFVCGQTVYDDAHLGHARTYIAFDVVARWLRHIGYEVRYAQNITDVEDKIIARAKERGMSAIELARYYEDRFMEDMKAIGTFDSVDEYPRSHDYIDAVRNQIQLLLDRDYAYVLGGDVYYDVAKFKDYTKLSGMKIEELVKHRIEPKEGKRNSYDFVLWKEAKEGEPSWDIKVSVEGREILLKGRPGWHIEDTAMTYSLFGAQYDIHGGASELIFPHHTNEIAQAEAAFGVVPFVRYWLHSGVLNIRGQKMGKSLKNFITIREALAEYRKETLRLFISSTHYRKEINYTDELMRDADKLMYYINQSLGILCNMPVSSGANGSALLESMAGMEKDFTEAMNDDFNTPVAVMRIVTAMKDVRTFAAANKGIDKESKEKVIETVAKLGNLLGILDEKLYRQPLPGELKKMIDEREELRARKEFEAADRIRDELDAKHGIRLEDTEYGAVWYPAGGQ